MTPNNNFSNSGHFAPQTWFCLYTDNVFGFILSFSGLLLGLLF